MLFRSCTLALMLLSVTCCVRLYPHLLLSFDFLVFLCSDSLSCHVRWLRNACSSQPVVLELVIAR